MAKRKSRSPDMNVTADQAAETTKRSRTSTRSKRAASSDAGGPAAPERVVATTGPDAPAGPDVIDTFVTNQSVDQEADVDPTEDEIRVRAYQRYLERGGGHGFAFDDWLHAEQELRRKR